MRLKAKTELLLYQLLWGVDQWTDPSFRKLDEGFEAWTYRRGFARQIRRLEQQGFLESRGANFDGSRIHRLTDAGRLAAMGGRNPNEAWEERWDQRWRLFLFDIPESERSLRKKLTRNLSEMGCGCLQGSVWISARALPEAEPAFPGDGSDCSHMMMLEAISRGAVADRRMVQAAWDFEQINELYRSHLNIMEGLPRNRGGVSPEALANWAERENESWLAVVRSDPLLPRTLLPKGYLGQKVWNKRLKTLAQAAQAVSSLSW